jgi:hypothetical protein
MGFGLVIGFTEHFQIVTTSKCSAVTNTHTLYNSLQHTLSLFSLLCLHQSLFSNGFQWQNFPLLWVPELSPCLSYQLLTAKHLVTTELLFSNSLTNQLFTSLQCTALTELNSAWSVVWYSLRRVPTENNASNSTSIIACRMLPRNRSICHNTFIKPQLLPSKSFSIHHSTIILPFNATYLATDSNLGGGGIKNYKQNLQTAVCQTVW